MVLRDWKLALELVTTSPAAWAERVSELLRGIVRISPSQDLIAVDCVGTGAQTCAEQATVPFGLPGGEREESCRHRLCSVEKKRYRVGPGGAFIRRSPGARVDQLETAPSGHLLVPTD